MPEVPWEKLSHLRAVCRKMRKKTGKPGYLEFMTSISLRLPQIVTEILYV